MTEFTHLHNHSIYSLLDGVSKIDELVRTAQKQGAKALALTDHGSMSGIIAFYQKCQEVGIRPILGVEAYISNIPISNQETEARKNSDRSHLVLLAQNNVGYQNLLKLTSESYLHGFYRNPRMDHDLLAKYSEGIICTSACPSSELAKCFLSEGKHKDLSSEERIAKADVLVEFYKTTFPNRYYLEIQSHQGLEHLDVPINAGIMEMAIRHNLPVICTNDVHYVKPEDAWAQDVLLAVQTNECVYTENRKMKANPELWLKPPEEMERLFSSFGEKVLRNTMEIADQCDVQIEFGKLHLPKFSVPNNEDSFSYLRHLVYSGAEQRYGNVSDDIVNRIEYELSVIKTHFTDYFLLVWDIIRYAHESGIITGAGRGSAAGSIVSYCLRITNIDPLRYGLSFERFLNPNRVSMPDIDLDFADDRRDEMFAYVREKYGNDHVTQIITFGTLHAKAAIRDVGRALGMPYDDVDRIAKLVPDPVLGVPPKLEVVKEQIPEFRQLYDTDPQIKKLIDTAEQLEGVTRHASRHAAGVVITDEELTELVPLYRIAKTGDITTQYDMEYVEKLGLLKMDFLGLRTLTALQKSFDNVKKVHGIEVSMDTIPIDDPKIYELIASGDNFGIFQLDSPGCRAFLRYLKPTEFKHVYAANALYRPGPMQYIHDFADRKNGLKQVTYKHPIMEEILSETYGVLIYQEQVMQIFQKMAGYTAPEADTIRRIIGKKKMEEMPKVRGDFVKRAVERGVNEKLAAEIFDDIEPHSGYSFNVAHAVVYSALSCYTAYMKAYYPREYLAAILSAEKGNSAKIAEAMTECRRLGIKVYPPDVNHSQLDFSFEQEGIRFGFSAIKNIGEKPANAIIEARQKGGYFQSLEDYCERVKLSNKKVIESLVKVGALDCFGIDRSTLIANISKLSTFASTVRKEAAQPRLFAPDLLPEIKIELDRPENAAPLSERLDWEYELAGAYFSHHPLSDTEDQFARSGVLLPSAVAEEYNGQRLRIGGIIRDVKHFVAKKSGQPMARFSIADMTSRIDVLCFNRVYVGVKERIVTNKIVVIEGKIIVEDGRLKIFADDILTLDEAEHKNPLSPSFLSIPEKRTERPKEIIEQPRTGMIEIHLDGILDLKTAGTISSILQNHKEGSSKALLIFGNNSVDFGDQITITENLVKELSSLARVRNCVVV